MDLINWIRPGKKKITKNKPEEDKDQTLKSAAERDKYTKVSEDMNLSKVSISLLVRFQQMLRFQESEEEFPRTTKMMRFSLW